MIENKDFEVKIPLFEGPFDLLLFFIRRDELDIHDIPISQITNDFLDYTRQLEQLNMEVASEFILVAATLMRIKAKMLLPRPELDEEGNEIDPREELVRHLLEYKKYKSVLPILEEWELNMHQKEQRGNVGREVRKFFKAVDLEAELQEIDLYKLLKVYGQVLERYKVAQQRPRHEVVPYAYTISEQKEFILEMLIGLQEVPFHKIVQANASKVAVIFNFLAILELLQLNEIKIRVGLGFNNFWIARQDAQEGQKSLASPLA